MKQLRLLILLSGLGAASLIQTDQQGEFVQRSIGGTTLSISRSLLEKLWLQFTTAHAHTKEVALIRPLTDRNSLCSGEQGFLKIRDQRCAQAVSQLIGQTVPIDKVPRIAIVGSGGGFRAMFSTMGALAGAATPGKMSNGNAAPSILDTVQYVIGLSGSTWAITAWMDSDESADAFNNTLIRRATTGIMSKPANERARLIHNLGPIIRDCLLLKIVFEETPSVIDPYALALGIDLLAPTTKDDYFNNNLEALIQQIADGTRPMPLCTAVMQFKKEATEKRHRYAWFEFSPFEVGSRDLGGAAPSWAFGRKFSKGKSTSARPPLTLGYLMGLWGSAMTVSIEEAYYALLGDLEPQAIFKPLISLVTDTKIGDTRLFPAKIRNITYKMDNVVDPKTIQHTLVDAGVHFNIPTVPALVADRDIDIIIIIDSSGNVATGDELRKAEAYARDYHLPFPHINYSNLMDHPVSVFDDGPQSPAPIVIYMPLTKNPAFDPSYDPIALLNGHLATTNFSYTADQASKLCDLFKTTMIQSRDVIIKAIKTAVERRS